MLKLGRSLIAALLARYRRSGRSDDPYALVRQPQHRPPGGRREGAAVEEPEPALYIEAVARGSARERAELLSRLMERGIPGDDVARAGHPSRRVESASGHATRR